MQPFAQLTERGQVRRLRQLAIHALAQYDLQVRRIRLIAVHTNTLFRVDTVDGAKYALRICAPHEHTLADNLAEVTWLNALRRDTSLHVPAPVANRDGAYITTVGAPGVPEARRCVLFSWIPGDVLDNSLTPQNYEKLGVAAATLHEHAASFVPPNDFRPMRWDKVFYFPHEPVVVYKNEYQQLFPPERMKIIEATIGRAEPLLAHINADTHELRVIHGDLHMWNVHVYRGILYLLDFEDLMIGSPLQDVAITFYYGRSRGNYDELIAAYEAGYKTVRAWPVTSRYELETLVAVRTLMFINYVAFSHSQPLKHIEPMSQRLAEYLQKWG